MTSHGIPRPSMWNLAKLEQTYLVPHWKIGGPVDLLPEDDDNSHGAFFKFSSALHASVNEQTRLLCAERALSTFPQWPGLRALLAFYYAKFEDGVSACEQIEAFYELCSRGFDPVFDESAETYCAYWLKNNPSSLTSEELYESGRRIASPWCPIPHMNEFIRKSLPANAVSVFARWRCASPDVIQRYLRYQAIETHEIEGVLDLDEETISCLTRVGFHHDAVLRIRPASQLKSKDAIIQSLTDCDSALKQATEVAHGTLPLDEKLVLDLHELVQRQSRFDEVDFGDGPSTVVKRAGALRGELCYTTLDSDNTAIVEFAPVDALPELFRAMVEDFKGLVNQSDEHSLSPLYLAAYMHYVFVTIHPFSDGNGRLGRMIGSLPLLRDDGPTILITQALRPRYLHAIQAVRETLDLSALVDVFVEGMEQGLDYAEALPPPVVF